MSTHLSASQRQLIAMQRRIAELEVMQREYNAFLNYVIANNGIEQVDGDKFYVVETEIMKTTKLLPIRSEIVDNGKRMKLRRVEQPSNNKIITLPE